MPSSPKPRSKAKVKAGKPKGSALDQEQRLLLEQQQALQAQIDAIQRSLTEAPQRAAEERRRTREAVVAATPRRTTFLHSANLLDTRHVEAAAASGRTRPVGRRKPVVLRKERADGRRQTLALIVVLAFALCWAASRYIS